MTVTCYEITHDGEGHRGLKYECPVRVQAAQNYAEDAARHFDGLERVPDDDLFSRVVEVTGLPTGPRRFRVHARIKRYYESTEEGS